MVNWRRIIFFLITAAVLIGAGLAVRHSYAVHFADILQGQVEENVSRELRDIGREAAVLQGADSQQVTDAWKRVNHFFIYRDSARIINWNRNVFLPEARTLSGIDSISFISSNRGDFLVLRWPMERQRKLYCVVTLVDRYPINNIFLSTQPNPSIFPVRELSVINPATTFGSPVQVNGKVLFRIYQGKSDAYESAFSFSLLLAGFIFLYAVLWIASRAIEERFCCDGALAFLLMGLLGLRLTMVQLSLPGMFLQSDIFDPKKFASSFLNSSSGDLLLNSICVLILAVYFFVNYRKFVIVQRILSFSGFARMTAAVLCLFVCFLALLFPFNFIEVIYHNSTQSLDITQSLSFDGVRIALIIAVLMGCVSSFLVIHIFHFVATHLAGRSYSFFFVSLFLAAGLFFIQYSFFGQGYVITLVLGFLFFASLRLLNFNRETFQFSFHLFIYLIFSLTALSLQNALAIRDYYRERQVQDQLRFGKDFLTERDVLGEYLLEEARQRIQNDPFIQIRMASPFLGKGLIADKIRRVHLNSYFDRYEVVINALMNDSIASRGGVDSLAGKGPVEFLPSGYPGISYANPAEGSAIKRYHVSIPIQYQRPVGRIILDLSLKRVVPDNVYPELLVDNRFSQLYRNRDFSYSIFSRDQLTSSFGSFNYERNFDRKELANSVLFNEGISRGGYYHVGMEDQEGSVAVVSAPVYSTTNFTTNFSFWFVLGLVFLFAGQGLLGIYYYFKGEQINYAARIQLFIFFAFLLPVLAVSITTLTLIGRANAENIQKDFLERAGILGQRMGDLIPKGDNVDVARLEDWIGENAAASKIDISIYQADGMLLATSQPALFEDQLLSPLMNRGAWDEIVLRGATEAVADEQIGKLRYNCAYSSVRSSESGKLLAIVALPFFESAAFLQKSQSLILSNILIVFVIVFILFSILSFWASRVLTFPIRYITKSISQTTLTGQNKALQWQSTDEIGTLVNEYNRMLQNLKESKIALAQTEKDSAWREIAKQVAHEIKNPLTPMKLTLQQMEQALKTGNLSGERTEKAIDVLLKQVEILNKIASSFSTSASMPAPSPQRADVNLILRDVVGLFSANPDGHVHFSEAPTALYISVDTASFSRAIGNMIINGLQSGGERKSEVHVTVKSQANFVLIMIKDQGKGMSEDTKSRIFEPHFTTKKTGSGLGLLVTRQIILQANGRIWFESTEGNGTVFYVEIPLVK